MSQEQKLRIQSKLQGQVAPSRPENTDLSTVTEGQNPNTPRGQTIEVEGVYIISVAARILDMHPQTLRKYERLGPVSYTHLTLPTKRIV